MKKQLALDTINKVETLIIPKIENEDIKEALLNEFKQLKMKLNMIKNIPYTYNRELVLHVFNSELSIQIDLESIYKKIKYQLPQEIDLETFESSFHLTIEDQQLRLDEIKKNLLQDYKHIYDFLLIADFWPTEELIFIDGLHKYLEVKVFNKYKPLKYCIANCEHIIESCINEIDKLLLIIIRETYIAQEYAYMGNSDLKMYY